MYLNAHDIYFDSVVGETDWRFMCFLRKELCKRYSS